MGDAAPDARVAAPPGRDGGARTYAYYFDSERPAFVTRLIARKHAALHARATAGRRVESVLEIGPGEGWFARACRAAPGQSYRAVEASTDGARRLRAEGFEVVRAKVPPLPAGLEQADLVYASHVVEHLPGPQAVLDLVGGARRLLRPGGAVALVFPDARRIGVDFWDCDYTHQWPSTPRRVRQLAHDAGFTVAATHHCCLHLTGWRAALLRTLRRLYPAGLLSALTPAREDFWYRGKMLFAPDVLMVLEPA